VEIPDTGGLRRFDGNTSTHHHFECEHCGSILDVELPLARGLRVLLEQRHGLVARQIRMHCQGLCPDCATESHA